MKQETKWWLLQSLFWMALLTTAVLLFTGCETTNVTRHSGKYRSGYARVTFYNPFERDLVRVRKGRHYVKRWVCWGRRTASGVRARVGTLAGPSWMPIGTKVKIPTLKPLLGVDQFVCLDRGKLDRDGGRLDVFVDNQKQTRWLAAVLPEYLPYTIQ